MKANNKGPGPALDNRYASEQISIENNFNGIYEHYRQFLEKLPVAAYLCDENGYVQEYNNAAVELFGRKAERGRDKWCCSWRIYNTDGTVIDLEECPMAVAVKEEEKIFGKEVIIERPDGTRRIVTPYPQPIYNSLGELMGGINVVVDITAQKDIEQALNASEEKYRDLFKNLPVAIYTCDKEGYITFFNDKAVELWGRAPELYKDLWCGSWNIYNPDGSPLPLDHCPMARTLKEGRPVLGEEIIVERPDGQRRLVHPYPRPIFDALGNVTGAVNMLTDVTEYKTVEEKIIHLAAIVQSSDDAIISKTTDGIITSWNEAAERTFGYTAQEVIGKPVVILIPPDRLDEEPKILERLKAGERVDHFETKRMTKDKKLLDISLTISPLRDSRGIIIGASKIARDITRQKLIERLAREGEERLRMAIESTKLGTWDLNLKTYDMVWSKECSSIHAVPHDMKVDYDLFLTLIHDEDQDRVRELMARTADPSGNGHYDTEYRIHQYNSGQIRWIRAQGKVYFDSNLKPMRFIGTVLDITDEKISKDALELTVRERTKELLKANEQLEKSNNDLEQFAYIASHDLQEPLRKIQTFTQLLGKSVQNPAAFQMYYEKINSSAQRMSVLINDVLNYSRVSRAVNELTNVDLNQVLHTVKTDFELLIEQKQAVVYADKLPVIWGNVMQIQQLFANLVSNALKFSREEPRIDITCRILSAVESVKKYKHIKPGHAYMELVFKDNGIGFEQKYAEKVFMIFQQLNSPQVYSGTGIGLALCKKIVENHGGLIMAQSEQGKGTAFTILLPVK